MKFYHVTDSFSMRVLTVSYIRCQVKCILVCLPRPQSDTIIKVTPQTLNRPSSFSCARIFEKRKRAAAVDV